MTEHQTKYNKRERMWTGTAPGGQIVWAPTEALLLAELDWLREHFGPRVPS